METGLCELSFANRHSLISKPTPQEVETPFKCIFFSYVFKTVNKNAKHNKNQKRCFLKVSPLKFQNLMFSPNEKNTALNILYSSLNSIQNAIWLEKKQGYIHPSCKHRDLGAGNRGETCHCLSVLWCWVFQLQWETSQ